MKNFFIGLYIRIKKAHARKEILKLKSRGVLNVGEYTYGIENMTIDEYKGSEAKVYIGKFCSISKNLRIITGGIHPVDRVSTFPFRVKFDFEGKFTNGMPYSKGDIHVGNDVWIGTGVTILSGVTIGDGAVIAANSTVTKNIAPYAIAGGLPCKVLKYRFKNETIEKLLELRWWDWDKNSILKNINFLTGNANAAIIDEILNK